MPRGDFDDTIRAALISQGKKKGIQYIGGSPSDRRRQIWVDERIRSREAQGEVMTPEQKFDIMSEQGMGQTHPGNKTLHYNPEEAVDTFGESAPDTLLDEWVANITGKGFSVKRLLEQAEKDRLEETKRVIPPDEWEQWEESEQKMRDYIEYRFHPSSRRSSR